MKNLRIYVTALVLASYFFAPSALAACDSAIMPTCDNGKTPYCAAQGWECRCTGGTELVNGRCECPSGKVLSGGQCMLVGGGGNSGGTFAIPNPINVDSIEELVSSIGNYLVGISGIVLTVMVLWGAFQIMTSGGSEEKVGKGRKTLYWAVLGFGILLIAGGLATVIADILGGSSVTTGTPINTGVTIGGFSGVLAIIRRIARWMFGILIATSIIMVLYSAFIYVTSGGDTKKTDVARKTLTYAVVALVISLFSGTLGVLIQRILTVPPTP